VGGEQHETDVPTSVGNEEGEMLKIGTRRSAECLPPTRAGCQSEVTAIAARRKADFERQLAAVYAFDQNEIWAKACATLHESWRKANEEIARESEAMGIPREFAPSLSPPHWFERCQNMVRERRVELTKVAYSRIEQMEKEAKLQIERSSVEFQTRLLANCLESADAKAFFETMPTPEQLKPAITVEEMQNAISSN
jgi:hypothetical protein